MTIDRQHIKRLIKSYSGRPSLQLLLGKTGLVGVEIGVQYGINAHRLLSNCDIKKLYLVDHYGIYPSARHPEVSAVTEEEAKEIEEYAHELLHKFDDRIEWVKLLSSDAACLFDNDSLDFVYIDGDHRYETVKKDIDLYYPKVKSGGLFAGHDFKSMEPGVVNAVKEKFSEGFQNASWDWWVFK